MKDLKNKNNVPTKSVKRIINTFAIIWLAVLMIVLIYIRVTTDIFPLLLYICMGALYFMGMLGFQKAIEKSPLKEALEETEKEYKKEEANMRASNERPDFTSLAIMAVLVLIYAITDIGHYAQKIISDYSNGNPIKEYIPQCTDALTLLICCIFIGIILYNVIKRRIFDRKNSICIYGVGVTIIFNLALQVWLLEDSQLIDSNSSLFCSLLGIFIIFFGRLFDIAVKLKKEQDLTI